MSRLTINGTPLAGVMTVDRQAARDERGYFARLFCLDALRAVDWPGDVAQVNESWTARRGSLRGMHYQVAPFADAKLVTCVRGAVRDVALDVRTGSPTFLQWHAETLSAETGRALLLPKGCAHGFQALTDDVLLVYCHSHRYEPGADAGIHPLDPLAGIEWPLAIADISDRDRTRPMLAASFEGVHP